MAGRGDSPGSKRDLAQAGTLAAAILAALVSADPFDARNRSSWVRHVDYVAIALWVAALVLFLFAGPAEEPAGGRSAWSSLSLPHWAALVAAGLAGVATIVAIAVVPFPWSEDHDRAALWLTPPTRQAVAALCEIPASPLIGKIPTRTLNDAFVTVTFSKHKKRRNRTTPTGTGDCDAIRIPASAIVALQEHP